jgi:hypothetical protein
MATDRSTSAETPLDNRAAGEVGVGKVVVLEGTELMVNTIILGLIKERVKVFVAVFCCRLLKGR